MWLNGDCDHSDLHHAVLGRIVGIFLQNTFALVWFGPEFLKQAFVDPFVSRPEDRFGQDTTVRAGQKRKERMCQGMTEGPSRRRDGVVDLPLRQRLIFFIRQVGSLSLFNGRQRLPDFNGLGQRRRWCWRRWRRCGLSRRELDDGWCESARRDISPLVCWFMASRSSWRQYALLLHSSRQRKAEGSEFATVGLVERRYETHFFKVPWVVGRARSCRVVRGLAGSRRVSQGLAGSCRVSQNLAELARKKKKIR